MSKQLRVTSGLVVLVLVVVLLVSSPGTFFAKGVSFIDTEIHGSADSGQFVRTQMDLSSARQMEEVIQQTEWIGTPYDWSVLEQQLGAEILTAWICRHHSSPTVVWFLVIQSKDVTSFHPPPVCYQALGYDIVEETTIDIPVSGEGWATEEIAEFMDDPNVYTGSIRVKKLVVAREENGKPTERRLVLYYYLKEGRTANPGMITMIRVSAIIPNQGPYDEVLNLEKKIVADFFPLMFQPREGDRTLGAWLLDEWGPLGGLTIAVMILIPVGFLIYPVVRTRLDESGSNGNPESGRL